MNEELTNERRTKLAKSETTEGLKRQRIERINGRTTEEMNEEKKKPKTKLMKNQLKMNENKPKINANKLMKGSTNEGIKECTNKGMTEDTI
ncbi:hypothetical protein Zmor_022829 [Zophobas morio]|uniref:Uncharacterized protein n=1 Tax=Zophobas morio TaxID=2755281 RepID=A0AA38HW89_9CUCU|nr:hypothetical protein Zmor_022829 [Zophobas morio]